MMILNQLQSATHMYSTTLPVNLTALSFRSNAHLINWPKIDGMRKSNCSILVMVVRSNDEFCGNFMYDFLRLSFRKYGQHRNDKYVWVCVHRVVSRCVLTISIMLVFVVSLCVYLHSKYFHLFSMIDAFPLLRQTHQNAKMWERN